MRSTTRTSAAALGCGLLLLVAGCSNDTGRGDTSTASPDATAKVGPLSAYFERLAGGQNQDDMKEQAQRSEEIVATCMREQGFEYEPQDMSQAMTVVTEDKDAPAYGSAEYAAKLGYGMSTQMEAATDAGAQPDKQWVDPNADYVAAMSETERQAFYQALYGKGMAADAPDPEAVQAYDWQTSGCQGKGQHEAYDSGLNAASTDPAFTSLQEELNKVWETVSTDPAMTAVDAEWSRCMADAGSDFATPQAAMNSISARMDTLYNVSSANGDGSEMASGTATSAPEPDAAAVAELHKVEIDTAVADHTCKESTSYDARSQDIQFAAEQTFVDAHRTELDAWADKYSQAAK